MRLLRVVRPAVEDTSGWPSILPSLRPPHAAPPLPTGDIFTPSPPSRPRFSTGFSYYGLAMDLQNFDFDIYVIQLIFSAVDIPAKLVSILTITYVGRRFTQAATLILGGLAILANILVPQGEAGGGGSGVPSSPTSLGGPRRAQPIDGIPRLGRLSFLWGICPKSWCLGSSLLK